MVREKPFSFMWYPYTVQVHPGVDSQAKQILVAASYWQLPLLRINSEMMYMFSPITYRDMILTVWLLYCLFCAV